MNIEEKAKAYTELINRLENVKEAIKKQNYGIAMDVLCKPYPEFQVTTHSELKESEDEKIRKAILWCISTVEHEFGCKVIEGFAATELKSWLEKQGNLMKALQISNARIGELIEKNYYLKEQLEKQGENNMGISEATKQKLEDNLNKALEKETPESWNEFLEKQGEQKSKNESTDTCDSLIIKSKEFPASEKLDFGYFSESTDKVEPKFHEGEWLVQNERKNIVKVVNATPLVYKVVDILGYHHTITNTAIENNYHLWTIQDAKDGDVLAFGEQLFLFKRMSTSNSFYAHYNYHFIGHNNLSVYDCSYSIDNIYPATKEQRDILFSKMKEAGYEWDTEKKELKKLTK